VPKDVIFTHKIENFLGRGCFLGRGTAPFLAGRGHPSPYHPSSAPLQLDPGYATALFLTFRIGQPRKSVSI